MKTGRGWRQDYLDDRLILVKFVQQRHQALLGEDEKGKNDDRQQFDVNNYDDINDIVSDRVNDDDVSLGWQTAGVSDIVSDADSNKN